MHIQTIFHSYYLLLQLIKSIDIIVEPFLYFSLHKTTSFLSLETYLKHMMKIKLFKNFFEYTFCMY